MAITVIKEPGLLTPVYEEQILKVIDSDRKNNKDLYYTIKVTIDGVIKTFKQLPDLDGSIEFNVNSVLQDFFESNIYINQTTLFDIIQNGIKSYTVNVMSTSSGVDVSYNTTVKYVFNGINNEYTSFNYIDYTINNNPLTFKFLNNWNSDMSLMLTDKLTICTLSGFNTKFNGIKVTNYKIDGTSNYRTITYSNTTNGILSIDISPSRLNSSMSGLNISDNTSYYTIEPLSSESGISYSNSKITVKIDNVNDKIGSYYRFAWVNENGVTNYLNATLSGEEDYNVKRNRYDINGYSKSYNTDVVKTINVNTDCLSENTSYDIKSLWYSPCIVNIYPSPVKGLILKDKSTKILNRRNTNAIIYEIEFNYDKEFNSQRN